MISLFNYKEVVSSLFKNQENTDVMNCSIKEFPSLKINLFLLLILISTFSFSKNLSAYLYLAQFKSPTEGPYIESYLNIEGKTVKFDKNENGEFQSKLEVLYLFKQNGQIKYYEKHILKSPTIKDSIIFFPNFTDVQRIAVDNGIYNFELKIIDLNDSVNTFSYSNILTVDVSQDYQFSDIEFVEQYKTTQKENILSKNGIDLTPYVSTYFPEYKDTLSFYSELYGSDVSEDFLLQYYIEEARGHKKVNEYSQSKRISLQTVKPIFKSFSIKELYTGNFNLVLSLRNKQNKEVCRKTLFFQRYNSNIDASRDTIRIDGVGLAGISDVKSIEQMKDYIKSLIPILDQKELTKANNILKSKDINLMKNFFNNYWQTSSANPDKDWEIYNKNVQRVNRSYSSQIKKGYETDRGRVFLKYGQPNDINKSEHEPSTYPYEIWQYFEVNGETNRKFVFYNPELVGEDYVLLHSNLTGEKNNPYWQRDLTKRNSARPNSINDRQGESQYGNRAQDLYNR